MSKLGKLPVLIPDGVTVTVKDNVVNVKGPKGELSQTFASDDISVCVEGKVIHVKPLTDEKKTGAFHGLYRNLIHNMVVGVHEGFSKSLMVNGVGYRSEVKGKILMMNLGFSNDFFIGIPDGLTINVDANTGKLTITGISKQLVGEFAAQIRKLRLPEPYKGKGIRYEDEVIKRKVGKTGVK